MFRRKRSRVGLPTTWKLTASVVWYAILFNDTSVVRLESETVAIHRRMRMVCLIWCPLTTEDKYCLNFSEMPGAFGIMAFPLSFSCTVWLSVFLCFFISIFCAYPLVVNVEATKINLLYSHTKTLNFRASIGYYSKQYTEKR